MASYCLVYLNKLKMNESTKKHSLKMSSSNIRGLNKSQALGSKMAHILTHLETDVKIMVDTHVDENTLCMLRKEYKFGMAKFNIIGTKKLFSMLTLFQESMPKSYFSNRQGNSMRYDSVWLATV